MVWVPIGAYVRGVRRPWIRVSVGGRLRSVPGVEHRGRGGAAAGPVPFPLPGPTPRGGRSAPLRTAPHRAGGVGAAVPWGRGAGGG